MSIKEFATVMGGSVLGVHAVATAVLGVPFGSGMNLPEVSALVGVGAVAVYVGKKLWQERGQSERVETGFPSNAVNKIIKKIDGILAAEQQSGAWVVWRNGREVSVMSQAQFARLKVELSQNGQPLTTLSVGDGRLTTIRTVGGKIHSEDGPAIIEWDVNGKVRNTAYYLGGRKLELHDFENIMEKRNTSGASELGMARG